MAPSDPVPEPGDGPSVDDDPSAGPEPAAGVDPSTDPVPEPGHHPATDRDRAGEPGAVDSAGDNAVDAVAPGRGRGGRAVTTDVVRRRAGQAVIAVDLAATFVFAVEGGLAGVDARLDVFGVLVVALVTATGGGMIRDVLMGDTPPRSLRTAHYVALGVGGGVAALLIRDAVTSGPEHLLTGLDAVGLALFAVSGAALALAAGMHPLTAILLGAITAVGGGVIRDVLLNRVPVILSADIYAVAALIGASVVVGLVRRGRPRAEAMAIGAACCFAVRMVSVWQGWNLPIAGA